MQLFAYSIHAACKHLHTNCIHFFICLYGMGVALSQILCMQQEVEVLLFLSYIYSICIYIPYLLDQKPQLLIFSFCSRGRPQFEIGYYLRADDLTYVLIIYRYEMMSCELDLIR